MKRFEKKLSDKYTPSFMKFDKCCIDDAGDLQAMKQSIVEETKRKDFSKLIKDNDFEEVLLEKQFSEFSELEFNGELFDLEGFIKLYDIILLLKINDFSIDFIEMIVHEDDFKITINTL